MTEHIKFCPIPFDHLDKELNRYVTCCPGWIDGSRFVYDTHLDIWSIWNHPKLVELRQAILDGDYRFCQKCPNRFRKQNRDQQADDKAVMKRPPVTVGFGDNVTCNLRCPSCRTHIKREKTPTGPSVQEICDGFHGQLQTVALNVSGDPFANPEHLKFMQTKGPEHLIIWTNGILLPRYWDSIQRKVTVLVTSIDAATKETYEWVRQPAKWESIQRTLKKCRDIMRSGQVEIWQCNFVVQTINFTEMPAFADMCIQHGATIVQFTPIAPWQHITPQQWRERNIQNPQHPLHGKYLEVLQSERLRQSQVDMGLIDQQATKWFAEAEARQDYFSPPKQS